MGCFSAMNIIGIASLATVLALIATGAFAQCPWNH